MYTWRPIKGEIVRFDTTLASQESIEDFFARHRVMGRGAVDDDGVYRLEIAITGRRKRVAIWGDGVVVAGFNLTELVETMNRELRKVEIDIGGQMAWGNIDLGEVDVEFDLPATAEPAAPASAVAADEADPDGGQGDVPEFREGPMLEVSDLSFAELPSVAASIGQPVSVLNMGNAKALLADTALPVRSRIFSSGFVIVLSTDPSGLEDPILSVCQEGVRRNWAWEGELPPLPWMHEHEGAMEFAHDQLGAGALVSRISAALPHANSDGVRAALLGPADVAAREFVEAVGLAPEVADCLEGLLEARLVPGATVFEPKPFTERLQSTVAYEVSGAGVADPGFWRIYRKLYLDHPRIMEAVASVQAGLGALMFAAGVRNWKGRGAKLLAVAGGALAINAGTRILLTQWVQAALEAEGLSSRPGKPENPAEHSTDELNESSESHV